MFLTPLTPLFKSSSINNDKYSGDLSFKLIKYSKSCKQTNKQTTIITIMYGTCTCTC